LRRKQSTEKSRAEGSLEWKCRWQGWIAPLPFLGEELHVSVEVRPEANILIRTVEKHKQAVNREGNARVASGARSQFPAANIREPRRQKQEQADRKQVHPRGQACQQVDRQRRSADQQRPTLPAAKPVVLKRQTAQGKQCDVVILRHVLRVMQKRGAE